MDSLSLFPFGISSRNPLNMNRLLYIPTNKLSSNKLDVYFLHSQGNDIYLEKLHLKSLAKLRSKPAKQMKEVLLLRENFY